MDIVDAISPFVLVFVRVNAFVVTCPVLIPESIPGRVRAIMSFCLASVLALALSEQQGVEINVSHLMGEVFIGSLLGLSLRLVAQAIGFAGELLDIQLGFSFARILNPMLGEEMGPIMNLCQLMGGVFFFSIGGVALVMRGLLQSLSIMPPGQVVFSARASSALIERLGDMMAHGLLLALPIVMSMVLVQLSLAFLSRIAQQLNVWSIGLLGTLSLGLLALWCNLPALGGSISYLWQSEGPRAFGVLR